MVFQTDAVTLGSAVGHIRDGVAAPCFDRYPAMTPTNARNALKVLADAFDSGAQSLSDRFGLVIELTTSSLGHVALAIAHTYRFCVFSICDP
jgi:hypothetical protein